MTASERESIKAALRAAGTIAGAARALGVERRRLSEKVNADPDLRAEIPSKKTPSVADRPSVTIKGHEATIVTEAAPTLGEIEDVIRSAGLNPAEWVVTSTTLNSWDALAGRDENDEPIIATLRQRKVTLARLANVQLVSPAPHIPDLVRPKPVRASVREADIVIVEGDHQAPYHDPRLDALATRFTADIQPAEHVFLGDTADFPTISRHPDHPAAMATAQECVNAAYHILRRRAEAAPNARRWKLKGNHDWRIEGELLARAERLHGLAPAEETLPALSLRRLLHLDVLGIELVEDPRGWQHGEVELVPGRRGLVVRHGWITGHNTAERSLKKRGRSLLVGHAHSREHTFMWDPSTGIERQAAVVGTMSHVRDIHFPHFAVCDDWLQGFATVTRWPDGRFGIEHAIYHDGALYWRDRRWETA